MHRFSTRPRDDAGLDSVPVFLLQRPAPSPRPPNGNWDESCKRGQQPRIGAPDPALTPNAGLAAITELCDRLGVISALDAAVGPVRQRDRGFGATELLCGIAAAQLAGRIS